MKPKKELYDARKTKNRLSFLLGVAICFALAGAAILIEMLIPGELLGASIIALFLGTAINSFSLIPVALGGVMKKTSKLLMVTALAVLFFMGML